MIGLLYRLLHAATVVEQLDEGSLVILLRRQIAEPLAEGVAIGILRGNQSYLIVGIGSHQQAILEERKEHLRLHNVVLREAKDIIIAGIFPLKLRIGGRWQEQGFAGILTGSRRHSRLLRCVWPNECHIVRIRAHPLHHLPPIGSCLVVPLQL